VIAWVCVFLLGASVGSLLDGIHTHSGMTEYSAPWIWMMAPWTPPLFGAAAVAIAGVHASCDRLDLRASAVPSWRSTIVGIVVFAIAYFASGYLPAGNGVKTIVLVAIFAGCVLAFDRSRQGLALACITAAGGVIVEHALTVAGAFRHLYQDLWLVPVWLPALYLVASVTIGNIGRRIAASTSGASARSTARARGPRSVSTY
jgi:hypothetical protein